MSRRDAVDYRDRIVLVTGASSGIGHRVARAFARRGAVVVAVARREQRLARLIEECRADSPRSTYRAGDLGDRAFAESAVNETVAQFGRLDILVNNAGISKHKHIFNVSADEAEHVMRVNFLSGVWTTLTALPHMLRDGGGTIVNVSSFLAKVTPPREALYAASKCAVNGFSEGLWHDLAGSNIHVGIVNPGPIDTEIWLKMDEPVAFAGAKASPDVVVDAVFEVIERRRYELTVPRSAQLRVARFVRLVFPSLMRFALGRFDPVGSEVVEAARRRAAGGVRTGSSQQGGLEHVQSTGQRADRVARMGNGAVRPRG
jgi:short-subunit dehydrogenase